jgi:hypothetical protein
LTSVDRFRPEPTIRSSPAGATLQGRAEDQGRLRVDRLLFAGNSLDKARALFAA